MDFKLKSSTIGHPAASTGAGDIHHCRRPRRRSCRAHGLANARLPALTQQSALDPPRSPVHLFFGSGQITNPLFGIWVNQHISLSFLIWDDLSKLLIWIVRPCGDSPNPDHDSQGCGEQWDGYSFYHMDAVLQGPDGMLHCNPGDEEQSSGSE